MAFRWILERVDFTEKITLSPSKEVYAVGRGKENAIKCLSLYVSRKHCKFIQRGENLAIVDLSSANGTYINQTRILSEREIPLQEGDLIGMGVSEITDSDCYVFRLYRNFFQKVLPQAPTLADSDSEGSEVIIITDSDSVSGPQKNGEAHVEITKKRPAEEEHVYSTKIPRLENAAVNWEASSDLSMTHFDAFPHSVDREWKKISEDPDDTMKMKKPECKQNSRPPDKTCIKTAASGSEVFVIIPECEEISALDNSINTSSRSGTVVARAHEPKFVSPSTDATNTKCDTVIRTVKNELQSMVDPVSLPSEVGERSETGCASHDSVHSSPNSFIITTAAKKRLDSKPSRIKRKYSAEPVPSILTDYNTTTSNQTIEAETEILTHSKTVSQTVNTAMDSVPFRVTNYESKERDTALELSVKGTVGGHCKDGVFNSRYPPVIKKEISSGDNNLQVTPAVYNCGLNKKGSEYGLEPVVHKELNNKELPGSDTKNASKYSNEKQRSTGSKSLCFGLKGLAADSAEHTSGISASVDACTSSTTATESGMCFTTGNKVIPEPSVKIEKEGVVFSFLGNNKYKGSNSNNGTTGNEELSAAQKCHSEETSIQSKGSEKKNEKVSVSQWGIPSGNQKVKAESFRNTVSKEESTKHLKKHTKKKLKVTEQSVDGSYNSNASSVSKESNIVCSKQSKSLVMTRDDKLGANPKLELLKDTASPAVNSIISSHGDGGDGGGEKKDEEEDLLSVRLQGVLYGDRNKAKSSIHCFTSHDSLSESVIKIKESSGILKQPVVRLLSTETPLDEDEQLMTKQKKSKSQRRHILSEASSSEDDELQKNQKKTESAEQTKMKSSSCLHSLKAKKTLLSTPESSTDSHNKSSRKSSTESVGEIKTHNSRPDTSIQNIMYSVYDDRGEEIAQANKIRVSSSSCVERVTVDDELFASIQRNKAIVKLERLDENALKSNGLVVSKHENESLNYTLDEDIIVISDDDEEYFPSSQIFDDQKIPLELLKTEDQDAAQDDPLFHKVLEDDDEDVLVFEDDESNLNDDQWFRRLSQQDFQPEPISELPPQLQTEKEKRDSGSREEFSKDVDLLQATTDGERIQKEMLAGDLLKTDQVKLKHEESVNKPKLSVKALVIDALPMPRRRASQRGISAEAASRMYKEQADVYQQQAKPTNIVGDTIRRRGKKEGRKKGSHSLTAKQKKQILDKRKEKLKAISEKEKAVAAASKQHSMMKVPAEVRIKVTNRNRGAFLTEVAETRNDVAKASEAARLSVLSSAAKNLRFDVKKAFLSSNVPKQDSVKGSVLQPKKRDSRSSSAPARSINDLPRIPKISEKPSTSVSVDLEVPSCRAEVVTDPVMDKIPVLTSAFSALSILKTSTPTRYAKGRKNVRFKKDSEMVEMRMIPVEEGSRLLPVAHKKDAPTPRDVFSNQLQQKRPDMDEVLYDILCWNPKWLEEQRNKGLGHPPPVHRDKLWPMPSSFVSYKDYLRVLTPLHLLELWASITNETEINPSHPRKAPVVVGIDQVDAVPRLTSNKKPLMHITCHAVLSDYDSQRRLHPYTGDLVYLELELENKDSQNHHNCEPHQSTRQRRIVPIFAYVKHSVKDAVIGTTSVHKEILKHSTRPSTKLILTLQAKFRPYDVKMSHAMRIKVVSYIKSDLRLFRAMVYLPFSPLCNHVLKPAEQDFSLPDHTGQQFVPLIKQNQLNESQKQAILKTADACLKSESKICMIHGPPGTGKSHVIVNLILQILYGQKQYHKQDNRRNVPKILICAPSNAAIDELVIRLLRIRQTIQKEERFRMVRTGREETMNPSVKDISVFELAKRDARSNAQIFECMESLDLEIHNLEARKNSLLMALETAKQKNLRDVVAETEFRLSDTELRLAQMRKSKARNASLDAHELWCMEREAQSRILLGAHIVATTLSSCFNSQMENIFAKQEEQGKSGPQFTCCIVDEATQSQEVETLIPLMLGVKTLVLVGDARQLPATVLSKVAKDNGLGKSLFARLQTCFEDSIQNPVQFLDVQYRMHPEICLWPNRFFYSGRLRSAPSLAQQRVCPLLPYCILSLEYKQNVCGELSNAGEAELVSQLTLGLLEKLGNQQLSIGIITPYHKQRAMIVSILHASSCASKNVEVNTIDSFQGQERDIIVMSCVRTGGVGFLSDTRRLNVALTRARYSLLLCGNFTSLQNDNTWRALLENAIQRNVLKHVPSSVARNKDELLKLVLKDM